MNNVAGGIMRSRMSDQRMSRRDGLSALRPAPIIVLVEPQMGENIGAAARAMLNFGVSALRLVAPRDGWPNPKAGATASGASLVIDQASVFETVEEAIADCSFVLAATARPRELLLPVFDPAEAAGALKTRVEGSQSCAILFGGERSGLDNDAVAKADGVISIPVNPAFASLNLAQAVLLLSYEWARCDGRTSYSSAMDAAPPANREDYEHFHRHLETELDAVGFFYPLEKKAVMTRNLRVAFQRAALTEPELRTLRGVIKALAKGRGRTSSSDN